MKSSQFSTPGAGAIPLESSRAGKGAGFRVILKSSALIGASSLINVGLGALRTKAMALLLGPAGIGLIGAFGMILDLARSVAQLGLTGSGVRQIAEAAASGDDRRLAVTTLVLRRVSLVCALLGAIVLWASSGALSTLTFGTDEHATSIALLSFALFLGVIAGGQGALLQGTRRVAELAKISVYGALLGTVAAVSIVYFAGERGIVPSLIAGAVASTVLSWWYSRKVRTLDVVFESGETARESALLLKLGLAFLASGLLMSGAAYAVRTFVLRTLGLEAAGMYQAAWTLGGLYVGFVLQALGTDFYPRLVGVANDHRACNDMVNEQAQASLLLAAPGIVATITFAQLVVHLFYSAEFGGAVELLRWMCLGMALRVITWPVGFIVVAKNRQVAFFALEAAWAIFNVAATWWCLSAFGLEGAGIAFMLSYIFHALIVYPTARRMTGFRWSGENLRAGLFFVLAVASAFVAQRVLPQWPALAFGAFLTLASAWFCVRTLLTLSAAEDRFPGIRPLLRLGKRDAQATASVPAKRPKVLALSSGGGHWVQLLRLRPAFVNCDVVFATVGEGYRVNIDPGEEFRSIPDANRWDKRALMRVLFAVFRLILRERPDVVITTGAAPGYFAIHIGNLLGARTIWVDSIANGEELSLSGRKAGPRAALCLTQWEHLAKPDGPHYRGSVL